MSNLTIDEVLKLRHLQLLQALDGADIDVSCDKQGTWTVLNKLRPRERDAVYVMTMGEDAPRYLMGVDGRIHAAIPPDESIDPTQNPADDKWAMTVNVADGAVRAAICEDMYQVEYTSMLHDLLGALRHAILAAPAKA